MFLRTRICTIFLVFFVLGLVSSASALNEGQKCRSALAKEGRKFLSKKATQLQKCNDKIVKGKFLPGVCPDAKATEKINDAIAKLEAKVGKFCGGADEVLGGGDDQDPADLGFPSTCPTDATPINTLEDLVSCIEARVEADVDALIAFLFPKPPLSCSFNVPGGILLQGSVVIPIAFKGEMEMSCGDPDSITGKAACTASFPSIDPVSIPAVGVACITPSAAPPGEIDCDGGNDLDLDVEQDHNIGTCSGVDADAAQADCEAKCAVYAAALGKVPGIADCETGECFQSGQPPPGTDCTSDSDCALGETCTNKACSDTGDPCLVNADCTSPATCDTTTDPHLGVCNCTAVGFGQKKCSVAGTSCHVDGDCPPTETCDPTPDPAGAMQVFIGVNIALEDALPCGDEAVTPLSATIPVTTEKAHGEILNKNNVNGSTFTADLTGNRLSCGTIFGAADLSGLKLVGTASFFDLPTVLDSEVSITLICP